MKVLIVDDDRIILEAVKEAIDWKQIGIDEVLDACDVKNAKEILRNQSVDIVISDIEMPGETGLDFLEWYRREGYNGRFLLLTSYESFAYASRAVALHAADYLVKPFHVQTMEMALKQNIAELQRERKRRQAAEYGEWILDNMNEVKLAFLNSVIEGKVPADVEIIEENIHIRKLNLDSGREYRLVVSLVRNLEKDQEEYGSRLFRFILTDFHSRILCGTQENEWVLAYETGKSLLFVTVCEEISVPELTTRCGELIHECGKQFDAVITCCISNPCRLADMNETYRRIRNIHEHNVIFYGEVFLEGQCRCLERENMPILDIDKLRNMLENRDKKGILEYLKQEMDKRISRRALDEKQLKIIQSEFQQAVYVCLAGRGVQISQLFSEPGLFELSGKSGQSVIDMMRWANHLTEQVFLYIGSAGSADTLIEKINEYIHEHYQEEIGRNEIGNVFHLVPEYLARVYKKNTGKVLKDYINEYRIEKAKVLLNGTNMRVSDIALQTGFDNISYFSTVFKKITGKTPNEYRKK